MSDDSRKVREQPVPWTAEVTTLMLGLPPTESNTTLIARRYEFGDTQRERKCNCAPAGDNDDNSTLAAVAYSMGFPPTQAFQTVADLHFIRPRSVLCTEAQQSGARNQEQPIADESRDVVQFLAHQCASFVSSCGERVYQATHSPSKQTQQAVASESAMAIPEELLGAV